MAAAAVDAGMVEQVEPAYWERDETLPRERIHSPNSKATMVYIRLGHFDDEMTPFRKHPLSGVAVHAARRHHSLVARHGKGSRDILPASPHASPFSPVSPLSSSKWEGGERGEIEFKSRRSRSLPRSRTKRVSFIHIIVASVRPRVRASVAGETAK